MGELDPAQYVINVESATFQQTVVERSQELPVVVDFWAPWCEPCRQLAPLLEKLAQEHAGRFLLAKVNVDDEGQIAAAFGVQSIPVVVALVDGTPVDHFQGLLPEDKLREWLAGILPSKAQQLLDEGAALAAEDMSAAEAKYRAAVELEPDNAPANILLAGALVSLGCDQEAREIIAKLEARGYLEPEAQQIQSELELKSRAAEAGGVQEARQAAQQQPENLELAVQLADALAAVSQFEEAFDICLDVIERDKSGAGVAAKDSMVKMFDMAGKGSELVATYRRRLATLLY